MTNKHFTLTDETISRGKVTLHRIQATRDNPVLGIRKDELGGFIEHERNLNDNAWVSDNAMVFGNAQIGDRAQILGEAQVFGNATVYGNGKVFDKAMIFGYARVSGSAEVSDNAQVFDNARLYASTKVCDDARVYDNAVLVGRVRVYNRAHVFGDVAIRHTVRIGNTARVSNSLHVACGTLYAGAEYVWSLYPTADNSVRGNISRIGSWEGTPDELAALAISGEWIDEGKWIDDKETHIEEARPELEALAQLWQVRGARILATMPYQRERQ